MSSLPAGKHPGSGVANANLRSSSLGSPNQCELCCICDESGVSRQFHAISRAVKAGVASY